MIHDALRSNTKNLDNVKHILEDHRNRISASESFRKGRHTFRVFGSLEGEIETPVAFQSLTGAQFGVTGSLDFDLLAKGRHLITTNGRIRQQTGLDFIVADPILEPTACAHVGGTIRLPNLPLLSSSGKAAAKVCYQYQPSSMTALGQFVAQNQRRLSRLERGFGKEVRYLTNLFFDYGNANCRQEPSSDQKICKSIGQSLEILYASNLGLDIPVDVKTVEQLKSVFWADPNNRFLLDDSELTRSRISALQDYFDGTLSDLEAYLIYLAAGQTNLNIVLEKLHDEQIRQGESLTFLSKPETLSAIFAQVVQQANSRLKKQQSLYRAMLKKSRYNDLSHKDRHRKFALSVDNIQRDYGRYESFLTAAERTLLLLSSFSKATSTQRNVTSTLSTIRSMGELVKTARILQEAYLAGALTSVAGLAAYSNGVTAALHLASAFSGAAQENDLTNLRIYLANRLDKLEEKIDNLADHTANNSMKLDALVQGQQAILQSVAATMEGVQATRAEVAFLTEMVRRMNFDFGVSSGTVTSTLAATHWQQEQHHRWLSEVMRLKSVRDIDVVIGNWLNPDSKVIETLNGGGASDEYLAIVRRDRQRVLELIRGLSTPEFVQPVDSLVHATRLYDRSVTELMGLLPAYAERAEEYERYFRVTNVTREAGRRDKETTGRDSSNALVTDKLGKNVSDVFVGLSNPDVLAHVVRGYLTFLFALRPEARRTLGVSDLEEVAREIKRLKHSREAASELIQPALVGALSALKQAEDGISAQLDRERLLTISWPELLRKVFHSDIEGINLASDITTLDGAVATIERMLDTDKAALVELARLGGTYLSRTGRSDGRAERKVLLRLAAMEKEDAAAWLIDKRNKVQVYQRGAYKSFQNIAWLYELYEASEIFEYSDDELNYMKEFLQKPILELSTRDVGVFIQLLKSSGGLLEILRGEGLVKYTLAAEQSAVDVQPQRPGQAYRYGILEYIVEDRNTGKIFGESQDPRDYGSIERRKSSRTTSHIVFSLNGCRGARIIPTKHYSRSPVPVPWGYRFTFPLDGGGFIRNPSAGLTKDCDSIAAKVGAKILHPRPGGGYDPGKYQELVRDARNGWEGFIRDGRLARPGTKFWHSGMSVCKVDARWVPSNAHPFGGGRIATLAGFVLELADSPFVYWSKKMAQREKKRLFAEDGTVITNDYIRRCTYEEQQLEYSEHPGWITKEWVPKKGGAFPRHILKRYWKYFENRRIVLPDLFRKQAGDVLSTLLRRKKHEARKAVGQWFQKSYAIGDLLLAAVQGGRDLKEDLVDQLYDEYSKRGVHTLAQNEVVRNYLARARREGGDFDRIIGEDRRLADPVLILGVLTKWALGKCVVTEPSFSLVQRVLRGLSVEGKLSTLEATSILLDKSLSDLYEAAAEVIERVNAEVKGLVGERQGLQWSELHREYFNRGGRSGGGSAGGCKPGHPSILELERYEELIQELR